MQALLSLRRVPASSDDDAAVERLRRGLENATQLLAIIAMAFAAVVLALTISAVGLEGAIRDVPAWAHVATAAFLLGLDIRVRTSSATYERLLVLDTLMTVGAGIGFSLFSVGRAPTAGRELVLLLFMAHTLILRAALVPSTPGRTVWLSITALIPSAVQAITVDTNGIDPLASPVALCMLTLLWTGTTTVASALVSRRIYGLQKQVTAARQLGPYIIEEKIGQGGMGEVYRARHVLLRRSTAIKIVRDAANPDTVARFEREVRLTSRLTHPNTVQVYDFGRAADGTFYYAMELIEGLTLWQLVERDGPQHPGRVVALLRQICASLGEAHGLGLIHRDVKPDNVLVCQRGFVADMVKVVDFGLARLIEAGGPELPGTIMGTAQYMSPEAVREPATIDTRADIYSVGALAYFLLTGTDLFTGDTPVVLSQQLHAVPQRPSSRLGMELPADLEKIVMRCLEKDPAMRPQSARELAAELALTAASRTWTEQDSDDWWRDQGDEATGVRPVPTKSGARSITTCVFLDANEA